MTKRLKILLTILIVLIVGLIGLKTLAQEEPMLELEPEIVEVEIDETVEAAELEVSEPKLLPDSPFYFFKNWRRKIQGAFTFNPIRKAELKLKHASERLLEARKLAEKTKNVAILEKASESYEKNLDEIKEITGRIKEKASENPKVGKFLDKFTKHQILHHKILEKLEEKVPEQAVAKIKETRERHLQGFGQVMEKLENKEKISERLEKNLEQLKGSKFKHFKHLEILKHIEEKAPERIKQSIREVRENTLKRLKEKTEQLSPATQEKFQYYIERIHGTPESKMEILEDIKTELKGKPAIHESLKQTREKILEKIHQRHKKIGCPMSPMIKKPDCPQGRIILKKDERGCIIGVHCIIPGEETGAPPAKRVCITLWDPVCGVDGKTYSNKCFAQQTGIEIAHPGACESK